MLACEQRIAFNPLANSLKTTLQNYRQMGFLFSNRIDVEPLKMYTDYKMHTDSQFPELFDLRLAFTK